MKVNDKIALAILSEIQETNHHLLGCIYERSSLGGVIKWSPCTGRNIPVNKKIVKTMHLKGITKREWWEKFGPKARQLGLRGPNLNDAAPLLTPEHIRETTYEIDDPDESIIRKAIVSDYLSFLEEKGKIERHQLFHHLYRVTGR